MLKLTLTSSPFEKFLNGEMSERHPAVLHRHLIHGLLLNLQQKAQHDTALQNNHWIIQCLNM